MERLRRSSFWSLSLPLCCLLLSFSLFLCVRLLPPSNALCVSLSFPPTPLYSSIRYSLKNFGDSYHHSPYRGRPTHEREILWNELTQGHEIPVSARSLDSRKELEDEWTWKRVSKEQVAAVPAVTVQLKCLYTMRQHIYANASSPARDLARVEVDQCIEYLRQVFMCSGEANPFLSYNDPHTGLDRPDLDVMHKCRDYKALQQGMKVQSVGQIAERMVLT